jgi:integrase
MLHDTYNEERAMSVRKRTWVSPEGESKEAWVVDYADQGGKRRNKQFTRKRDAEAYHARVAVDLSAGLHTAISASPTVVAAGATWMASAEANGLERSTLRQYRQHLDLHIIPLLGAVKLAQLTVPMVRAFQDKLRSSRSPAMARKVLVSLGSILSDAQQRGLVAQNVVRGLRAQRQRGGQGKTRRNGKLKVGVEIPTPEEMRAIITHLEGRWRPFLLTAIFTGLRSSELRGLRWNDVDLRRGELHVRQRADRYHKMGQPKSQAGERAVPLLPMVVAALREWKLACPKGELNLVFPNTLGHIESHPNIIKRALHPVQVRAGVTKHGKAKYTGLHAFRHFYASWCINRRVDGGLELPLKVVQARLGHASIQMTADRYGHLFPRGDDGAELAAAERAFLRG